MNLLDLPGPDFLGVYVMLLLAAAGVALFLRWWLRVPAEVATEGRDLPPYEAAYLAEGDQGVLRSALATLVHRGAIAVDATSRQLRPQETPKADLRRSGIEQKVFAAFGGASATIENLKNKVGFPELRQKLQGLGWVLKPGALARVQLVSIVPLAVVLLLGVAKILIGLDRNRPVEYLVILVLCAVAGTGALLLKLPLRTRAGDRVLSRLRGAMAALGTTAAHSVDMLAPEDLALAVGLFGVEALAQGPLAELGRALKPPRSASSGGCGSGGCGGGGGGGGCGGGCGGCGA